MACPYDLKGGRGIITYGFKNKYVMAVCCFHDTLRNLYPRYKTIQFCLMAGNMSALRVSIFQNNYFTLLEKLY